MAPPLLAGLRVVGGLVGLLIIVQVSYWTAYGLDPEVIEGEAGLCGPVGMAAVVHVNHNHIQHTGRAPAWYGWSEPASPLAIRIAAHPGPDPTHGALHLFSRQDLERADVQALIAAAGYVQLARYECEGGLSLHAYGPRPQTAPQTTRSTTGDTQHVPL